MKKHAPRDIGRPTVSSAWRRRAARRRRLRGAAAVEAVFVLNMILIGLLGIWEVGRIIQIDQILNNAARHGARTAAIGTYQLTSGSTTTTINVQESDVKNAVRNYLTANHLPAAAVEGANIELVNLSGNSWTHPYGAKKGDHYKVRVSISADAYKSLQYIHFFNVVGSQAAECHWKSANDDSIVISDVSTLPK